jgi:coenzyme F420-reducing hydrogenase beta subunit
MTDALQVGDFTLELIDDGKFWIENSDGEAMECSEKALEAVVRAFFEENL